MIPAAVILIEQSIAGISDNTSPISLPDVQTVASSFAFEDDEMALPLIGGGITSLLLAAYRLCRSYQDSITSRPEPEDVRVHWTDMENDPPDPDGDGDDDDFDHN